MERTDNEIIKALECCIKNDLIQCKICPYYDMEQKCRRVLRNDVLDLLNRQRAEIERLSDYNANLQTANTSLSNEIFEIKSEAIKEFAERLKKKTDNPGKAMFDVYEYYGETIDKLVKEMTEEKENA